MGGRPEQVMLDGGCCSCGGFCEHGQGGWRQWVKARLNCWGCVRRRNAVHVVDADLQDQDSNFHRPHRRTYYYSIFAARLGIMVMLAILIGLLTILTWHFTVAYTTRSIKTLAYSLRTELLQRPISRMWNLLNATHDTTVAQVYLSEFAVGQYALVMNASQETELYGTMRNISWAIFVSQKTFKTVFIIYKNGHLQAFDRSVGSNQTEYFYSQQSNGSLGNMLSNSTPTTELPTQAPAPPLTPVSSWPDSPPGADTNWSWYYQPVDPETGQATGAPQMTAAYDLTKDIQGVSELKQGGVTWHVTVNANEDSPLLSSSSAIRHPANDTIFAVTGITTALSSISLLMRELTDAHKGYIYLTTADGYLLASSTSAPLINDSGSKKSLVLANESSDPVIHAGAEWLWQTYGKEGLLQNAIHVEDIYLGNTRYYIDTFSLNLPRLPLVGVIITPRSFVMGEVDHSGHATLAILISISSCILLVGCIFILILTSGVSTEMKLRAELINHLDARRRAEASSNYKSQFLANMSHELRTPMAAVIGLLDILLCDDYLTAEQVNMVSQIRRCSTALLRLLNNILDLSKVESGMLLLEEADFDLGRELEGLIDMFSVQCVDHNIEIVLDLADEMQRIVRGDSARTMQIFANLIANSIKFTSSGHVIVRGWCGPNSPASALRNGVLFGKETNFWQPARLGRDQGDSSSDRDKIQLWFEVEDTGCGIDPSKWEMVFDSFVQADPSTTRTYGGTGLGLCIVRSLVQKMSGDIKVVRKQGPGTLLRLFLLFDRPSELSSLDISQQPFPAELEQAKVLIAIRGDMGRTTLAKWMKSKGLHVYEASAWDEAMVLLRGVTQQGAHGRQSGCVETITGLETAIKEVERPAVLSPDGHASEGISQKQVHSTSSVPVASGPQSAQNSKMLVIMDSGFLRSEENLAVQSKLATLDEFRRQGVMISWLLNHNTSSSLKTQLRQTGYTITANEPLYKSKVLQLLTLMMGINRNDAVVSNERVASDLAQSHRYQLKACDGLSPGSLGVQQIAGIDHLQVSHFHSQIDNKLGFKSSGSDEKLAQVLVRMSSAKSMSSINKSLFARSLSVETGNTLESTHIALDQGPDSSGIAPSTKGSSNREEHLSPKLRGDKWLRVVTGTGQPQPGNETEHSGEDGVSQRRILLRQGDEDEWQGTTGHPILSPSCSGAISPVILGERQSGSPVNSTNTSNTAESQLGGTAHLIDIDTHLDHLVPDSAPDVPIAHGYVVQPGICGQHGTGKQEPTLETRLYQKNEEISIGPSSNQPALQMDVRLPIPCLEAHKDRGGGEPMSQGRVTETTSTAKESSESSAGKASTSATPFVGTKGQIRPAAKKPSSSQHGLLNSLAGIRILLAEDTPVLQRVATIMLEKMGACVVVVGDGLQAVDTLRSTHTAGNIQNSGLGSTVEENTASSGNVSGGGNRNVSGFDLVLMDCQMPRMDGYDATKAIRKAEEGSDVHIPIVALTAHAMSSDEAKCLQVGMDAYLTKPIDRKLMVSTILSLTRRSK